MSFHFIMVTVVSVNLAVFAALHEVAAAAQPQASEALTQERRQDLMRRHQLMVDLHSNMIRCLEAGKSYEICHKEAMSNCKKDFAGTCPGMGAHHSKKEMGLHHHQCFWMLPTKDSDADTLKKATK